MPPLTIENASALIGGGGVHTRETNMAQKPTLPQTLDVEVVRSFMNIDRKPTKVGETVTLPRVFALEMIAANKAKLVAKDEAVIESPKPATAEKPSNGGDGKKGGGRNAA